MDHKCRSVINPVAIYETFILGRGFTIDFSDVRVTRVDRKDREG